MFPTRYFPDRYFAPRYWPKVGAAPSAVSGIINMLAAWFQGIFPTVRIGP